MPYDGEIPPGGDLCEPPEDMDRIAHAVIGAAIEVHRELGGGLPETSYENAMCVELRARNIPFERQKRVMVYYKGVQVGYCKIDLLVDGKLIVEIKSVASLTALDQVQVRTYMRIIGQPLALLLNFNVHLLKEGIRRVISSDLCL